MKQISNEVADILNEYILAEDSYETIQTLEDAINLNWIFNNAYDIDAHYHPYRKYKYDDTLNNWDVYWLWETLYESMIIWWFWYFRDKFIWLNKTIQCWYSDYLYHNDELELQKVFDMLSNEEQLSLYRDPVCKYYIELFSLQCNF